MRLRSFAAIAAALALAACDGKGTSPAPTLEGVWATRPNLYDPTDSLTLALGQQGSEVSGFAILRRVDNPGQYFAIFFVHGSLTGQSAELHLGFVSPPAPGALVLRATLSGAELSGAVTMGTDKPVTLRRSDPRGGGVAGTYALVSTTPSDAPAAIRDTIVALPDGRARRHREQPGFAYGTQAVWSRRGDWLVLEQLAAAASSSVFYAFIPYLDSLRIEPDALVRSTPVRDGVTLVETYRRVP
ncbi:MAG: hypothetical protein ABR499_01100 [Gemmatimonadaceae bacterium]